MPKSPRKQIASPDPIGGYTPPANPEAEQSVLGAILVRPEVLDGVTEIIIPGDFYREAHGLIFRAMLDLSYKNEPVDLVTVTALLKERGQLEGIGGPVYLAALSEQVGFAVNADYYAGLVRDKSILRRLLEASQEIAGACFATVEDVEDFIDTAEARIFEVRQNRKTTQVRSLKELSRADYQRMEDLFYKGQEAHGLATGFYDYDRMTVGLHSGELTILAARPGMGKTALALNIAWNVAHNLKEPCAFFSLEMPERQLVQRLASSAGRIDGSHLRRCILSSEEWAARAGTQDDLDEAPMFIEDKAGLTALELRAKCRRIKARLGLSLVIVDYLQLMGEPFKARSRDEAVGSNCQSIKELAKELNLPILVCCQVNREIEKRTGSKKKYQLADLRESGNIEQAADNILFLWREKDAVVADLQLEKQRNGPVGNFRLIYSPAYTRFDNYAE